MTARRIGGSFLSGRLWAAGAVLCALALAVLAAASLGFCHVHAQAAQQTASQSGPQANSPQDKPSGALTDSSDAPADPRAAPTGNILADSPDDPAAPAPAPTDSAKDIRMSSPESSPAGDDPTLHAAPAPAADVEPASVMPAPPISPAAIEALKDPRQRQVASECADLFKMATDLKAAVDKSTKDELSVEVVRKAGEIEQYARKVKDGTRLTAGKE
jgi:hypothetical protein